MSIIVMSKWVHLACQRCHETMVSLPKGQSEKLPDCIKDGTERCCWCNNKRASVYFCMRMSPRLAPCRGVHKSEKRRAA